MIDLRSAARELIQDDPAAFANSVFDTAFQDFHDESFAALLAGPEPGEVRAQSPPLSGEPAVVRGIRSVAELKPLSAYAGQKIEYAVERLIPAGGISLITGESGSGKTSLIDSVLHSVVTGTSFAGLATQRRPALVLDRENPISIVSDRRVRLGIPEHPSFRTWGGWCEDEPPDPGSPIITEWVAQCSPPPVVTIDSLAAFARCDENSASDMRAFFQPLRRLADMGASVILLHHCGKGETSREFRGSSDIKAAVDVAYHLANLGDSMRLSTLRLRAFKARFAVESEITLHYVEGFGFRMDDRGPILTCNEILRGLLIENARATATEFEGFAALKGIASHKARQFLNSGIEAGTIRTEKGPRNTKYHVWKTQADA